MLFSEMRTRFAKFLHTEDTVQPMISTTDRDALLNEAALEYLARYGNVSRWTAVVNAASGGNNLALGVANDGQWVECLAMQIGSTGRLLERRPFPHVLSRAPDLTGLAGEQLHYGLALVSRTIDGASVFKVAVGPRAAGVTGYRALIRPFATPLANANDVLEADDEQVDQAVRIAALRAGSLLGYSTEWFQATAAPLPEQVRTEMAIDALVRFPTTSPRQVAT